jgi:hypothetical protein
VWRMRRGEGGWLARRDSPARGIPVRGIPARDTPAGGAQARAAGSDPQHQLVALVTRLVVAQTGLAAVIGLCYSRRHLSSVMITLMVVAALWGLVLVVRTGTQAGWLLAVGAEMAFVLFGLFRFATSRYLGGTLFAIITIGTLLHPAVARAFGSQPAGAGQPAGEASLAEPAEGAFGGSAAG